MAHLCRLLLIVIAAFLAALVAGKAAADSSGGPLVVTAHGTAVEAEFLHFGSIRTTGAPYCSIVDLSATSMRSAIAGAGTTRTVNMFGTIFATASGGADCSPDNGGEFLSGDCVSDSAVVNIDRSLQKATLSGVLTCTDYRGEPPYPTCSLSASLTLQGTGSLFTSNSHYLQLGDFMFNEVDFFQSRESARTVSLSVSGCGLPEDLSAQNTSGGGTIFAVGSASVGF
jgi:hypothetical protein